MDRSSFDLFGLARSDSKRNRDLTLLCCRPAFICARRWIHEVGTGNENNSVRCAQSSWVPFPSLMRVVCMQGLFDEPNHRAHPCSSVTLFCPCRDGVVYILLTTLLAAAVSLIAVVHLTSHEVGAGAGDTPRLPVRHLENRGVPLHSCRRLQGSPPPRDLIYNPCSVAYIGGGVADSQHGGVALGQMSYSCAALVIARVYVGILQ